MKLKVLAVNPPQYDQAQDQWSSLVNIGVIEGNLDFSKVQLSAPSWPGGIGYESMLVSQGSSFSLRFYTTSLTGFVGNHPVNFKLESSSTASIEIEFPGYIRPFYFAHWDAGPKPTIKVGDCSCVTIECVGLEPGSEYLLKNILRSSGAVVSRMVFEANSVGIYKTRSDAEIPESFLRGVYDVRFYGPGISDNGWKVDEFTIADRLDITPIKPIEPIRPGPGECPPPKIDCPAGSHIEPVYATVMPAACSVTGWRCSETITKNGPVAPPAPSCSIRWKEPFNGKIAERKHGEVTDIKLTVINLKPAAEFKLQNVHSADGVISEMTAAADSEGILLFEDHESIIPFGWPVGSYKVKVSGSGVNLNCGGFNLMQGTPVCAPGMILDPGGQCIPTKIDRKLWIFVAVFAGIFYLSRR